MEKVEVYVEVCGDYCAFHELNLSVVYDVTNNIQLGDKTIEELECWDFDFDENSYRDYEVFKAIKDGDEYYILI